MRRVPPFGDELTALMLSPDPGAAKLKIRIDDEEYRKENKNGKKCWLSTVNVLVPKNEP